ncbi:MAG: hypothetical protein EB168_08565, partial [Euryarchaeota archaeon]|nr:hypothetical protein [Euryarchaeota archaeon]
PAADPTDILRESVEDPSDDRMSRYVKTLRDVDQQQRKREVAEGVELKETDLLGGADQAVTQAQLRKATGEMFARIQTSLASLGGGGLGTIMQGVEGTPSDGQLPMYNDSSGKMVWATVFGVGEAYGDSDALEVVLSTVDSAYVQARVDGGLDSAAVINLITGTVDSDYVAARDSDGGFYTTADHDSDTLVQVDSAYVQARQIKYLDSAQITNLIDSAYVQARDSDGGFYTTADHDSDTLVQVDSAYVQARQLVYGDADVRSLLAGDSGVFNIIPAADSTYDLGDSNTKWRDLWLSGNTIHLGSQALQSRTDGVYANGKKLGFADSAYTTAQHDSDTLVQVDSAYVQIRVKSTDFVPEGVSNLYYETARHDSDTLVQVDSAYVQARQIRTLEGLDDTQIDSATIAADDFLRWNGTDWIAAPFNIEPAMDFHGSIDVTVDSAPKVSGGALYVNTGSGVVLGSYAGIAGDSIDSGQAVAFANYDSAWHILGNVNEAGVVEVRQGNGISVDDSNPARPFVAINRTEVDTWYVDSARVEAMIDSEYVNLHSDHYTTANHDSDTLVQVDSAYVQLRVGDIVDSAKIVQIIDSYVDSEFVIRHADSHFVNAAGDSMTGKLFAPAIQIGPDPDNSNKSILFLDAGGDSVHELEVIEGTTDAVEWDDWILYPSINETLYYKDMVYGGGVWVSTAHTAGGMYSTDGKNWEPINVTGTIGAAWSVAYGNNMWVGVIEGGSQRAMYSTDGINWTVTASADDGMKWVDVAYGGDKFVAVGHDKAADRVMYSTDGINWTSTPSADITSNWNAVVYDGTGKWVVVASGGDAGCERVMYSSDGISWTAGTAPTQQSTNVVYGNGTWVACADGGSDRIMYSTDGETWTGVSLSGLGQIRWRAMAWTGNEFVVLGPDG